jgi:hypothetical protein
MLSDLRQPKHPSEFRTTPIEGSSDLTAQMDGLLEN